MSKRDAESLLRGARERDPLFVGSVDKAFRVLEAFRERREPMSLAEIAETTALPKSAAQRACHTLVALGYLARDAQTRRLKPSPKLLDFAYSYLRSEPLVERATPIVIQASERCGERVNMSVRDGDDLIYAIRIPRRAVDVESTLIGRRWPLASVAGGRAILSTLPPSEAEAIIRRSPMQTLTRLSICDPDAIIERVERARETGYALNEEEALRGEIAVAAPVRDRGGLGVAAVHIAVSSVDWSVGQVEEALAPLAIQTANAISRHQFSI